MDRDEKILGRSEQKWREMGRGREMGGETDGAEEGETWSAPDQRQKEIQERCQRWAHRSQEEEEPRSGRVGKEKEGREKRGLEGAASTREGGGRGASGALTPRRPQTSLLLLLLLSPGLRGTPDCSFPHSPISSTFTSTIGKLVSVPAPNPRPRFCLWV